MIKKTQLNASNDNLRLFALIVSGAVSTVTSFLIGLLLIEIADAFNVSVGVAGQLNTARFVLAIFFSLITSLVSVRYDHKFILQIGLLAFILSALGCFFASDFITMMFFYSMNGIGYALGVSMIFT